jgi:hypothetical protein
MQNICFNPKGNELCTDGKHTYHQWNTKHSSACYHCKMPSYIFWGKCQICKEEIKKEEFCECKRCKNCGKIIK